MADEFAYGKNEVNGAPCPALAAGLDPEEHLELVEYYDEIAVSEFGGNDGSNQGILDRNKAEAEWEMALSAMYDRATRSNLSEGDREWYQKLVDVGERVQNDVFTGTQTAQP